MAARVSRWLTRRHHSRASAHHHVITILLLFSGSVLLEHSRAFVRRGSFVLHERHHHLSRVQWQPKGARQAQSSHLAVLAQVTAASSRLTSSHAHLATPWPRVAASKPHRLSHKQIPTIIAFGVLDATLAAHNFLRVRVSVSGNFA